VLASEYLPATKELRQFMVYKFALHPSRSIRQQLSGNDQEQEVLRRDLLADIALMMMRIQNDVMKGMTQLRAPLKLGKICELFHVHETDEERCDEEHMLSTWTCINEDEAPPDTIHPCERPETEDPYCEREEL